MVSWQCLAPELQGRLCGLLSARDLVAVGQVTELTFLNIHLNICRCFGAVRPNVSCAGGEAAE